MGPTCGRELRAVRETAQKSRRASRRRAGIVLCEDAKGTAVVGLMILREGFAELATCSNRSAKSSKPSIIWVSSEISRGQPPSRSRNTMESSKEHLFSSRTTLARAYVSNATQTSSEVSEAWRLAFPETCFFSAMIVFWLAYASRTRQPSWGPFAVLTAGAILQTTGLRHIHASRWERASLKTGSALTFLLCMYTKRRSRFLIERNKGQ